MHRVGYLLSDGFQVMALASQAVFEYANLVLQESFYRVESWFLLTPDRWPRPVDMMQIIA